MLVGLRRHLAMSVNGYHIHIVLLDDQIQSIKTRLETSSDTL